VASKQEATIRAVSAHSKKREEVKSPAASPRASVSPK